MGLKTNYKIMFFTFIISMFMAMSLNNFVSSGVFLPALFLYFISNLAVFLEKSSHGYTRKNICTIIIQNLRVVLLNFIISLIMGLFGIICCRVKAKHMSSILGYPQYAKYFWLMFATTLIISFGILIIKKKPK